MALRWLNAGLGLPIVGLLILGVVTTSAQQTSPQPHPTPQAQAAKPANIDRNGVLMLIRSTLVALDHANKTGNYTVLRDLGAPGFQVNTAAKLAEIFAKQRGDKLDLSGVTVIDPQLSLLPQIEPNGMLHMAGFFPSVPSQVNFELLFAPVEGQWRVFGVSLLVGQTAPVAPEPPESKAVASQKQAAPSKPVGPSRQPAPTATQ
ncbi:hypothetical protein [Bradyrhizobium sp. CB2312]|uniref:hypothetical protein n=1 Tax=Bradyrhizobium sp. CB2312 TaxID=3039155 RepID=UPI0024B172D1|nr:hypothetical protein [Bradyrhizobium sp. CB2312]WFU71804.1 hypothetical protein QA642_42760 [Bradyrhizobium sp. CB2312]